MSRDGASGLPATVWYNVGDSSGQHASSRHRNDNKREKSPSYSPEPKQNGHEKRRLSEEFKQSKETIIKLEKDVKAQKRYLEDTLIKHANEKQALEREIERLRHQTEPDEDDMSELREQISDKDEVICKLEHQVELTVQELKKVTDHSKSISQELCKLKSAQVSCMHSCGVTET